jgi:hypothetical protein
LTDRLLSLLVINAEEREPRATSRQIPNVALISRIRSHWNLVMADPFATNSSNEHPNASGTRWRFSVDIVSPRIGVNGPDFCHLVRWCGAESGECGEGVAGDRVAGGDGLVAGLDGDGAAGS